MTLFKTRSYVLNTLACAAMTFAIGGLAFWTPSYIYEYRGLPNLAQVNMIFGASPLALAFSGRFPAAGPGTS